MAEGGRENGDGDNRYFRNVGDSIDNSDKDSSGSNHSGVFCEPDLGAPRKKDRDRIVIPEDEKVPRREENPFSFRHFLNKDQPLDVRPKEMKPDSLRHCYSVDSSIANESGKLRTASDFTSGLPDFVQDHLVLENYVFHDVDGDAATADTLDLAISAPDQCLPDFAVHPVADTLSNQYKCDFAKKSVVRGSQDDLVLDPSCKLKNIRKSTVSQSDVAVTSSLPDFLSDGPMMSNHTEGAQGTSKAASRSPNGVHRIKVQSENENSFVIKLQTERDDLVKTLRDVREQLAVESAKVFRLQSEVEILRLKEVDDTAALEKVVQQVETNLQNTAQRAVNSETIILKLRQEVKALQCQVATLKAENKTLRSGNHVHVTAVAKKAKMASEQISAASATAEQQLKQLLSGLESLRLVSAFLADIDRVTEDPASNFDIEKL